MGLYNSLFLTAVREFVEDSLAFFRFTEASARAVLSANGLYAPEMDGPQKGSSDKKERGRSLDSVSRRWICEPRRPIPIGVHLDFTRANWTTLAKWNFAHTQSREPISAPPSLTTTRPTISGDPVQKNVAPTRTIEIDRSILESIGT
jgi:hypothetical protein